MNILYIGSSGAMSLEPLRALLDFDYKLCAVGVDVHESGLAFDTRIPIIFQPNLSVEMLARANSLPIINLNVPQEVCIEAIQQVQPDVILVSCFGRKLTDEILSIAPLGCFNLHPSMLPSYRGPVPLFWQFRAGEETFGVSLHRMTEAIDAGPIIAQRRVSMPDGINNLQASELITEAYVELLPDFLRALSTGLLVEALQDEALASYQGYPDVEDFTVSTEWSARRIYNFMRATRHWGAVYPCEVDGETLLMSTADGFEGLDSTQSTRIIDGDQIQISCCPGLLTARLA